MKKLWIFNYFGFLILLFDVKKVVPSVEILLHDEADALRVEAGTGEVAVVGLIVDFQGKVSVGEEEIANVKIADKRRGGGIDVVAIAELAIDKQAVVEHTTTDKSFIFSIVPALVACRNVGSEVPVVAFNDLSQHGVDLSADGS